MPPAGGAPIGPPQSTYNPPPGMPNPQVTMPAPEPMPSSSPCASAGGLLQAIYAAALNFRFQSTAWSNTECGDGGNDHLGNCACAAAVQRVIFNATGVVTGSYSVETWLAYAQNGSPYGGAIVPDQLAVPGDIIFWWNTPGFVPNNVDHIGICASDQCTQTLSNSSSASEFAPFVGNIDNTGAEFPYHLIWEPAHIP